MTSANERFAVSAAGLRELHADRSPASHVAELVQNAFDEVATFCEVLITPGIVRGTTSIVVTDDGPGFQDITHAWTLMAPTPKRGQPDKRGRFNLGEKTLISVARSASIETVGHTITFPETGGREARRNRRTAGTVVTVIMPWSRQQAAQLEKELHYFFPPSGCRLIVNNREVPRTEPVVSHEATLRTVLQNGPGKPMRSTTRRTTLEIHQRRRDTAWLYEMGIPVQEIACAWDVDVQQKVPMPPNRDTVGRAYLQDLYAEVLNATHHLMAGDEFANTWIRTAIEDDRATDDAIRTTKVQKFGAKTAMWSPDHDANLQAVDAGYQILHPRTMSEVERRKMRRIAGVESTHQLFGQRQVEAAPAELNPTRQAFAQWIAELATRVGLSARIQFIRAPDATTMAQCTAHTANPTITINVSQCPDSWLAERGHPQITLIIHELAHAYADTPGGHGPAWGEACAQVGGRIAADREILQLEHINHQPE